VFVTEKYSAHLLDSVIAIGDHILWRNEELHGENMSTSPVKQVQSSCNDTQAMSFFQSIGLSRCGDTKNSLNGKKAHARLICQGAFEYKSSKQHSKSNVDNSPLRGSKWPNALNPRVLLKSPAKENLNGCFKLDSDCLLDTAANKIAVPQNKLYVRLNKCEDICAENNVSVSLDDDVRFNMNIDLCSELGQALYRRVRKRNRRVRQTISTVGRESLTWYDMYCNGVDVVPANDVQMKTRRSAATEYTISYNGGRRPLECVHEYNFTKFQQREFCRRIDTGLNKRSRRLKRQMILCNVQLRRLSSRIITYWSRLRRKKFDHESMQQSNLGVKPCSIPLNLLRHCTLNERLCVCVKPFEPKTSQSVDSQMHSVTVIPFKPCYISVLRLPAVKRCTVAMCRLSTDDLASITNHSYCCKCRLCDCPYVSAKSRSDSSELHICNDASDSKACSYMSPWLSEQSTPVSVSSSIGRVSFRNRQDVGLLDFSSPVILAADAIPADCLLGGGLQSCRVELIKCDSKSPSLECDEIDISSRQVDLSASCSIRLNKLPLDSSKWIDWSIETETFTRQNLSYRVSNCLCEGDTNSRLSPILRLKVCNVAAYSPGNMLCDSRATNKQEDTMYQLPLTPKSFSECPAV